MKNGYIYVKNNVFPTIFAISEKEQQQGLMNVPYPCPIMSFVYASPRVNKFWMSNTPCPLDIAFCNNGRIYEIQKGEPYSTSVIGSDKSSDLVIEFPHGTIFNSKIKLGDKVGIIDSLIF